MLLGIVLFIAIGVGAYRRAWTPPSVIPAKISRPITDASPFFEKEFSPRLKKLEKPIDENHLFGYIKSIEERDRKTFIDFDLAEWISNRYDESQSNWMTPGVGDLAAIEDGACGVPIEQAVSGSCTPNGFYIRNNSTSTEFLEIHPSSTVTVLGIKKYGNEDPHVDISFDRFKKIFTNPSMYESEYIWIEGYPYHIELLHGRVIKITAKYLP